MKHRKEKQWSIGHKRGRLNFIGFIKGFGVSLDKIKVNYIHAIQETDDEALLSRDCFDLAFFFAGRFEAIPSSQWDFYFTDLDNEPAIFEIDENTPERVKVDDMFVVHETDDKKGFTNLARQQSMMIRLKVGIQDIYIVKP